MLFLPVKVGEVIIFDAAKPFAGKRYLAVEVERNLFYQPVLTRKRYLGYPKKKKNVLLRRNMKIEAFFDFELDKSLVWELKNYLCQYC